ncbi:MAG: SEC59/DGK1/VTE5 family protein [archaeon]|nr:SEC59/DGK1/VTE5 family protein [archaeon]
MDKNLSRKIVHIGVGNFVFVWWFFTEPWVMLVFFTIPFAVILFLAMFEGNPISRSKIGQISRDGHNTGLFLYAISISIMVIVFFDHWAAASIGIIAMTYGDALGSIIGKKYGRHKMINGKSFEGTFAVFATTTVVGLLVLCYYRFLVDAGYYLTDVTLVVPAVVACMGAGVLSAVAELLCPGKYDNLIIPTLVAGFMVLMGL